MALAAYVELGKSSDEVLEAKLSQLEHENRILQEKLQTEQVLHDTEEIAAAATMRKQCDDEIAELLQQLDERNKEIDAMRNGKDFNQMMEDRIKALEAENHSLHEERTKLVVAHKAHRIVKSNFEIEVQNLKDYERK